MTTRKTIAYASTPSPLGPLWAAVSDAGLWAMNYAIDGADFLARCAARGPVVPEHDPAAVAPYLQAGYALLTGEADSFELPIDWSGMTAFQVAVRQAVMAIPAGHTASYGQIAAQVGRPEAARAVGRVNATNPMLFAVPCHRVIGADGALTGFGGSGGVATKQRLLAMEGATLI